MRITRNIANCCSKGKFGYYVIPIIYLVVLWFSNIFFAFYFILRCLILVFQWFSSVLLICTWPHWLFRRTRLTKILWSFLIYNILFLFIDIIINTRIRAIVVIWRVKWCLPLIIIVICYNRSIIVILLLGNFNRSISSGQRFRRILWSLSSSYKIITKPLDLSIMILA